MATTSKINKNNKLLRSRFGDFRNRARRERKYSHLRMTYTLSRFILLGIPIRLRSHQKLAIIGCGRSATRFSSRLFQNLGIQIGHERLEKQGIASWTLVPDTSKMVWGPSYNLIRYLNMPMVHQVRHPLDVISSVETVFSDKGTWDFIRNFIPIDDDDSLILKSMKYWYYWNILAEEKAVYTYRIENITEEMRKLIKIGQFDISCDLASTLGNISKTINTRKHPLLSWDDLKKTDERLTNMIIVLAKKYGYSI